MKEKAIGVFDSGLGGLTVLKEIKKVLPNENVIYFGDTARVPYGSKTSQQIKECTMEAMEFFASKNVKAVIIACNTATASALTYVKEYYDFPVFGVIEPGAKSVINKVVDKDIAVIATDSTISSGAYELEISKYDAKRKVIGKSCPPFVGLVEGGLAGTSASYCVVRETLKDIKNIGVGAVVLGCTHYPYLKKEIKEVLGSGVELVDPAEETAINLQVFLSKECMLNENGGLIEYYVSKSPQKFKSLAQDFMGHQIQEVEEISLLSINGKNEMNIKIEKSRKV